MILVCWNMMIYTRIQKWKHDLLFDKCQPTYFIGRFFAINIILDSLRILIFLYFLDHNHEKFFDILSAHFTPFFLNSIFESWVSIMQDFENYIFAFLVLKNILFLHYAHEMSSQNVNTSLDVSRPIGICYKFLDFVSIWLI